MLERSSIKMLLIRLNWPVRLTRWMVAKQLAGLLESNEFGDQTRRQYLIWLSEQRLESEILSGLAVLLCVERFSALPDFDVLQMSIRKHSVLSTALLSTLYKKQISSDTWSSCHSGPPPSKFEIDSYFNKNKSVHIATIFALEFEHLESTYGLPFTRQWAFEWSTLMQLHNLNYSGYPHHFVSNYDGNRGLRGQFEQGQSDVFRSAYLRTLSLAVDFWGMPKQMALDLGALTLPLNKGLTKLSLSASPSWLSDIPSCCAFNDDIEPLFKKLMWQFKNSNKFDTLVELRAPLSSSNSEFGKLHVTAILVSIDYVPSKSYIAPKQFQEWALPSDVSMEGILANVNITDFQLPSHYGCAYPVCLNLFPKPFGFWQSDIISNGISLPASYCFTEDANLNWVNGCAVLEVGGELSASYQAWLDHWSPVHFKDGGARTGFTTLMQTAKLEEFMSRNNLVLAWNVVLEDVLDFDSHTTEPKLSRKHIYFPASKLEA